MLIYTDKLEGYYYTPTSQKGKDIKNPFRVKLKLLSAEEIAELHDLLITRTSDEVKTNYGLHLVQACYKGIIGWENITTADGSQLPFKSTPLGTIAKESLDKIPYKLIEEIGAIIVSVSENPKNVETFGDKE